MNRRQFLRGLGIVGGAVIAERAFPFRTYFFPSPQKTIQLNGIVGVVAGDVIISDSERILMDIYSTDYTVHRGTFLLNWRTGVYEPYAPPLAQGKVRTFTRVDEGFLNLMRAGDVKKVQDRYIQTVKVQK